MESFWQDDKNQRPTVFFADQKKESMRKLAFSRNLAVKSYKDIHIDLERRLMILWAAKLGEHYELYVSSTSNDKFVQFIFYCRPIRKGGCTTAYEVGKCYIRQSTDFEKEAWLQSFNDCMRRRTGLSFGKSPKKPVVI